MNREINSLSIWQLKTEVREYQAAIRMIKTLLSKAKFVDALKYIDSLPTTRSYIYKK